MDSFVNSEENKTLGTAQLGMSYGVANNTGQPDFEMGVSIIKTHLSHP